MTYCWLLLRLWFDYKNILEKSSSKQFNVTCVAQQHKPSLTKHIRLETTFMTSAQRLSSFIRCFHDFYSSLNALTLTYTMLNM